MKEKELTAVEYLVSKLFNCEVPLDEHIYNEIEQAKDIEMKHLAQAFEDGEHNYFYSKKTGEDFENGIEYYNEKFKQQEQ
jgi:ribosomal protein S24E